MRRANVGWIGLIVLVVMVAVAWPASSFAQAGAGPTPETVAGKYQGTAKTPDGDVPLNVDLKIAQGAVSGTIDSGHGPIAITGGSLAGDRVTLNVDMGGTAGTIAGTVKGDRIDGTWTMGDATGAFTLTRVTGDAAKAAADPSAASGAAPAKPAADASADPLTGEWSGVTGNNDMSVPFTMRLKLEGDKVTGDISSDQGGAQFTPGSWKDGALTISFEFTGMGTVLMVASFNEGKLVGTMDFSGQMQMAWAAVKKPK